VTAGKNKAPILLLASSILLAYMLVSSSYSSTYFIRHISMKSVSSPETQNEATTVAMKQNEANMAALKFFYTKSIESEVSGNNWNMGCSDLNVLAPYVRIVMDRYNYNRRQLIFDVGANNGQDASMVLGVFQQVIGMCESFGNSFKVVSIEPSPKVFCELEELAQRRGWPSSAILCLNVGLSNTSGVLAFYDPGHEGGMLQGSVLMDLPEMSVEDLDRMTSCHINDFKNYSIDDTRTTNVTTYTVDQLVNSLESPSIHEIHPDDHILILKNDTEGHDLHVIQGSNHLLADKRISFVLFEVWSNLKLKAIVEFMDQHDYICFIIFPIMLVPVHAVDWWYPHLDNFTGGWWGNGFCGIRNSPSLSLLYKAFHADNDFLMGAHDLVMERSNSLTHTAG
jgi:FkbM family methyltransferase